MASTDPKTTDDKPVEQKPEQKPAALGEDDEFEDFPVDDWPEDQTEAAKGSGETKHLWEESWDDDDTSDDFSQQLREELKKVDAAKRRQNQTSTRPLATQPHSEAGEADRMVDEGHTPPPPTTEYNKYTESAEQKDPEDRTCCMPQTSVEQIELQESKGNHTLLGGIERVDFTASEEKSEHVADTESQKLLDRMRHIKLNGNDSNQTSQHFERSDTQENPGQSVPQEHYSNSLYQSDFPAESNRDSSGSDSDESRENPEPPAVFDPSYCCLCSYPRDARDGCYCLEQCGCEGCKRAYLAKPVSWPQKHERIEAQRAEVHGIVPLSSGANEDKSYSGSTTSESDSDIDSDSVGDSDSDVNSDANSDADSDSIGPLPSGADEEMSHSGPTASESDSDRVDETDSNTDSDADSDSGSNASNDADSDTDSDTDSDIGIVIESSLRYFIAYLLGSFVVGFTELVELICPV